MEMMLINGKIDWGKYNKELISRGMLTIWIRDEVFKNWVAKKRRKRKRGRYIFYSHLAILTMASLSQYFRFPLRQTQGFFLWLFGAMGVALRVPYYTTLCRRRKKLKINISRYDKGQPINIVVDSTGVKTYGAGEWRAFIYREGRKGWLKLHIAVDADTGEIKAWFVSLNNVSDADVLDELLSQIKEEIREVIGDGAYDRKKAYEIIEKKGARAVIKPRKGAKISPANTGPPTQRDKNVRIMQRLGLEGWKRSVGYNRRNIVESVMSSFKRIFGGWVRARSFKGQVNEIGVKLWTLNKLKGVDISYEDNLLAECRENLSYIA